MKPADVACVVLASGLSQRFGEADKLKADLCGKPVLDHVLETVSSVGYGENFLVSQDAPRQGFTAVINTSPASGQGHALRIGLEAARAAGRDCICVVLGDMPLVELSHLKRLMNKLGEGHSVVSAFEAQLMPPAIFRGPAISSILAEISISGARAIFHQLTPAALPFSAEAALDVDTPEDLARVARIMKARKT